ncbi:hypothetical protein ACF0H5_003645 [Mactra antiquata]
MSKKQATLFQSWGNKSQGPQRKCIQPEVSISADASDDVIDLCGSFEDEDDDLLFEAEESIAHVCKNQHDSSTARFNAPSTSHGLGNEETNVCDISVGADNNLLTQTQSQCNDFPGFDKSAGKLWIYPTNYPVRDYQFNIVKQALFKNTMVTLPTGLGKTFIAAVVMYNFYRWYPQGKVIFMAPTKPLVAQQIEACYNIMGIPQDHTAEMTGSMGPSKREKAWHDKRVFFLTPQVLTNDLSRGTCPAVDVKCLVIDEAHKALGNHAYCQVVRELIKYTQNFRVLSLSATPGSDIKAVQQVLNNLLISQIEIRTEESIDIKQYSHERKVEKIVVPLGDELSKVKEKYVHIMDAVVTKLKRVGALYHKDTTSLSKFLILKAREGFRQNPPERLPRNQYGVVEGDFALAMSLYHGYELLQLHGSRSLYTFLDGILTGEKGYGRTRTELMRNADFNDLMKILSQKYQATTSDTLSQAQAKSFVIGHPKMEKLQDIVVQHFNSYNDAATRVMIFSQYRDSVQEITHMLDVHKPLVKVMSFIGQATTGKSTKGFTQKEQLKVMKQFREGGYNTLVSTCVGEEGLDIGDVDLIICFDAHKSPIRLVQRMGRTGRKREGRIVMLVTQGKEEQIYNQSQYSKRSIHKAILNGAKSLHFYQHCSRMIPENLNPTCHKMHITVKENFKPTKKLTSGKSSTNHSKINTVINELSSKKDDSDEIITLEEYRELEPWLVPETEISKLPIYNDICCLDKNNTQQQQQEPDGKFLSLSEWSLWQTTQQETEFIDHSKESKHFVEIMEFVQLQQTLDPSDDPYGLEMAAYFNEEDVVKSDKNRRNSILNFCVKEKNQSVDKGKKKETKSRVRRSDNLPKFDFLPEELGENSDEELPAFNINNNNVDKPSAGVNVEKSKDNEAELPDIINEGDLSDINNRPVFRRSESVCPREPISSKAKMLEKKMAVNKREKKRKKSRHHSGQTSMISLIEDNDSNDFEINYKVVPMETENTDNDENVDEKIKNPLDELPEPHVVINAWDEVDGNITTVIDSESNVQSGIIRIRTPPHEADAVQLCEDLDLEMNEINGINIDLLALVDEWHSENKNGKYIVYPADFIQVYTPFTYQNDRSKIIDRRKCSDDDLCVSTDARNSKSIEIMNENSDECDISEGSFEELPVFDTSNLNDRFKKPSVEPTVTNNSKNFINERNGTYKKLEKSPENMVLNDSKSKILSEKGRSVTMETDSDDDIMATGTFALAAEGMFSDDSMDEDNIEQNFDVVNSPIAELPNVYDPGTVVCDEKSDIDGDRSLSPVFHMTPRITIKDPKKINDSKTKESDQSLLLKNKNKSAASNESMVDLNADAVFSSSMKFDTYDDNLDDADDDSVFMAIKTPNVVDGKLHETNTQITFTQAVNFVHSGLSNTFASEPGNDSHRLEDKNKCGSGDSDCEVDKSRKPINDITNISKDTRDSTKSLNEVELESNSKCGSAFVDSDSDYRNENIDKIRKPITNVRNISRDSKDLSTSEESNKSEISAKLNLYETSKNYAKEKVVDDKKDSNSDETDISKEDGSNVSEHKRESTSSDECLELPQFDLDFDFDEDIIPPSPNNQLPSQTSKSNRLSQAFSFSNKLSQTRLSINNLVNNGNNTESVECVDKGNHLPVIPSAKKCLNLYGVSEKIDSVKQTVEEESQSILGDIPVRKLALSRNKRKLSTNKKAHNLDTIDENNVDQPRSDAEINVRTERRKASFDKTNSDQIKCNVDKSAKTEGRNENTDDSMDEEFATSFALVGDDFDDWIETATPNDNPSCSSFIVDKKLENGSDNGDKKTDSTHSLSDHSIETGKPHNFTLSIKKTSVPIATVNPFNSSQDFSVILPSERKKPENTKDGTCTKDTKVRESMFNLDDLSPDAFEDSFEFSPAMLTAKSTPKCNLKSQGLIQGTSTPIVGSFKQASKVLPFGVENVASPPSTKVNNDTDDDDSFIVRRKKKVNVLSTPISERKQAHNNVTEHKSSHDTDDENNDHSRGDDGDCDDDDFDDGALCKTNNYFSNKPNIIDIGSSDEDFEESFVDERRKVGKPKDKQIMPTKTKSAKRKRANPFLDEEADLSGDEDYEASSDEAEGSDLDVYDNSFIAGSQCSQVANDTDIHAVYLKSVKSPPLAARGGFKLQFNHRNDIDVFSQVPEPENSEYMEDSFCVDSEADDWLLGEGEELEETREVTMMQNSALYSGRKKRRQGAHAFQTSRQRAIQAGRMKALDEIRAKLAGKGRRNEGKRLMKSSSSDDSFSNKPLVKRSRIQVTADSSFEEEVSVNHSIGASQSLPFSKTHKAKKTRFLMSSDSEDDNDDFAACRNMCKSNKASEKRIKTKVLEDIDESMEDNDDKVTEAERKKLERLQRQKEQQEEYRKRIMEKSAVPKGIKMVESSSSNISVEANSPEYMTMIKNKAKPNAADRMDRFETDKGLGVSCNVSSIKPIGTGMSKKPVILIDSKEISGAQDIVSDLRFKHNIQVSAAQLPGCDFVISNRMAVERKQWSEFSNGANRAKLVDRIQHLCELYDRPCLVVEKDRIKPGEEKSVRPVNWTKYIDRTIALLLRSNVQVFYSDNMHETAELLADLCKVEERKQMGIIVPVDMDENKTNLMKFFTSIPKLSYVHALNLCDGFKSLSEFLKSNASDIESKGKMSKNRALDVVNFIKRGFDPNMLPKQK